MQKLKNIAYGVGSSALLLVPGLVSAQVGAGAGWTSGYQNAGAANLPGGSLFNIINATMQWLLGILGFIAVIGFVIAGILYLTAAGNESQAEKAKNAMTYSIIGVIVALVGFIVLKAVTGWLSTSTTF